MNTLESSVSKIEQALAAKTRVQIVHVYRDPVDALVNGSLKRAMGQKAKYGTGRTVPMSEHIKTHKGSSEVIVELARKYKDNPNVVIKVVNNSLGKGNAKVVPVSFLEKLDYTGMEEKLKGALENEYKSGRISEDVYLGSKSFAVGGTGSVERRSNGTGSKPRRKRRRVKEDGSLLSLLEILRAGQ